MADFPCFPSVRAKLRLQFRASLTFWLVHWGILPALFALPSRFPNGRLTPRAKNSCTYSTGMCSGLQPDFLIPTPALIRQSSRGTRCSLFNIWGISFQRISCFFCTVNGFLSITNLFMLHFRTLAFRARNETPSRPRWLPRSASQAPRSGRAAPARPRAQASAYRCSRWYRI